MAFYYIRTAAAGGSSGNNGTSYATAWDISKLGSFTFSPGDIILHDGVLPGPITFASNGTSGNPITITSYLLTNIATIDGQASTTAQALKVTGAFVNVQNIIVQNSQTAALGVLLISGTHDVNVTGCYVTNGYRGIHVKSCTGNIVINGNWVDNISHPNGAATTGPASGDGSHIQCDNIIGAGNQVINNNVWANAANGYGIGDLISLFVSTGTIGSNLTVSGNKIRGGGLGTNGYCSIGVGDNNTSTKAYQYIYNNLIAGAKYAGIQIAGGDTITVDSNKINVPQSTISLRAITCYNASPQTPINITVTNNKVACIAANGTTANYFVNAAVATPTGMSPSPTTGGNTAEGVLDAAATDSIIPGPNLWTGTPWNAAVTGYLTLTGRRFVIP